MARFYLEPTEWGKEILTLRGPEAHHCLDVLRMKVGDLLTLFNGLGLAAEVELVALGRDRVECRPLSKLQSARPNCRITLAQAIPKGKAMDLVIEKATELRAAAIVPLLTSRTVVQLDERESARKQEKWQRVALEATKQCGQNWLPQVARPQSLAAFFKLAPKFDLGLTGSLENDARPLKAVLAENPRQLREVLILIGPEGDFSPAELELARAHGCQPISFGPVILRAETAAIYSLSILGHELLDSLP